MSLKKGNRFFGSVIGSQNYVVLLAVQYFIPDLIVSINEQIDRHTIKDAINLNNNARY